MKTGAIILAAGFSRRFGGVKLSAVLPNGSTVLLQSVHVISQAVDNWLIVTRPELLAQGALQGITPSGPGQRIVLCHDAIEGMGHSLAEGMKHVPENWDACLVYLADMPFIKPETIRKIVSVADRKTIVCPVIDGQRGHPVCFGSRFFPELALTHGDTGGRQLMHTHRHCIVELDVGDQGILQDIDTPSDLTACQP